MAADDESSSSVGLPLWVLAGFLVMAAWNAALSGGSVYFLLVSRETDDRFGQLIETNRVNAEITAAQDCISSHAELDQIRAAIGIVPDVIVEISGGQPDTDPAQLQAFLDGIADRVNAEIKVPACDLTQARADLEELTR
jgi:hypothetical protein